jgi:hypothetical protein
MQWVMLLHTLVRSDRTDVDTCADLLGGAFDKYIEQWWLKPLRALLPASCANFDGPRDPPLTPDRVDEAAQAAVVALAAEEHRKLRAWLSWIALVFGYLNTIRPQYASGSSTDVMMLSRLGERIYDGIHPIMIAHVLDLARRRRHAFERGEHATISSDAFNDAVVLVTMVANADQRRPDAQPRRNPPQRRKTEAEKEVEAALHAPVWQPSPVPPPLLLGGRASSAVLADEEPYETEMQPSTLQVHLFEALVNAAVVDCTTWIARDLLAEDVSLARRLERIEERIRWEQEQLAALFAKAQPASARASSQDTLPKASPVDYPELMSRALLERGVWLFLRQIVGTSAAESASDASATPELTHLLRDAMRRDTDSRSEAARVNLGRLSRLFGRSSSGLVSSVLSNAIASIAAEEIHGAVQNARDRAEAIIANPSPPTASRAALASTAKRALSAAFVEALADAWSSLSALVEQPGLRGFRSVAEALKGAVRRQLVGVAIDLGAAAASVTQARGAPKPLMVAELLARYVDFAVRKASETRLSSIANEDELLAGLKPLVPLVHLIADRDLFVLVYRQMLAERLLSVPARGVALGSATAGVGSGGSADGGSTLSGPGSPELEAAVLSLFRPHCAELREADGLLTDTNLAADLAADLVPAQLPFVFAPTIVAQGRWPPLSHIPFAPPMPVLQVMQLIENKLRMRRKKMQWYVHGGRATAAIALATGSREVSGGLLAIAALYHINDEAITVGELASRLSIMAPAVATRSPATTSPPPPSETNPTSSGMTPQLRETLLSLGTAPKLLLLNGNPTASPADVNTTLQQLGLATVVAINTAFTSKTRKIELKPVNVPRASGAAEGAGPDGVGSPADAAAGSMDAISTSPELLERRRLATEAAVTRVMKSRKEIPARQLIEEVQRVLARVFECPAKLVRDSISALIEKEYLERVDGDPPVLRYLA